MEPIPTAGVPPQSQPSFQSTPDRDIEENKDIAALGYVWVLSIFVFLYRRNSAFVRHHARQGIVLFVLSLIFWAVPVVGHFLEILVLALMIMGFLNAAQGKYAPLPLIYAMSHGDMRMLRESWKVVVDAVVRLWRKIRSKHPSANIKVSVQTTPEPSPASTPSSVQTPPVSDSMMSVQPNAQSSDSTMYSSEMRPSVPDPNSSILRPGMAAPDSVTPPSSPPSSSSSSSSVPPTEL